MISVQRISLLGEKPLEIFLTKFQSFPTITVAKATKTVGAGRSGDLLFLEMVFPPYPQGGNIFRSKGFRISNFVLQK